MRNKNAQLGRKRHKLDTVGVAGSIPVEPTILKLPKNSEVFEIPEGFDVIPAVEWRNGLPRFFRVLIRKSSKRGDFAVTSRRSKKSA